MTGAPVRSPANSPFTPGYGILPSVWAGRAREFADFDDVVLPRVRARTYEQARLITGDRGVGKTVFLAQLAEEATEAGSLTTSVTARTGSSTSVIADMVRATAATLHAASAADAITDAVTGPLQRRIGLRVSPRGIELDLGAPDRSPGLDSLTVALRGLLERTARVAAASGQLLLATVDEAQNATLESLEALCHTLADVQSVHDRSDGPRGEPVRSYLPLAVYLAGLPSLPERIRRSGSTFFERSLPLDFELLRAPDIAVAIRAFLENEGVGIEPEALERLVDLVGGYPYFLHLYGKHAWQAGTGSVVTVADVETAEQTAGVDLARFYGERLRNVGDLAHDWLMAAARLPPEDRTVGAVAAQLGRTSSQLGSTVDALVGKSLIRPEPGRGQFSFAVPGLDRHLRGA